MPPTKVKIERIAGDRTRQNTFHKRKLGLIKKAIELTVLTECDIAIIMRSGPTVMCPEGRVSAYCNKNLEQMITEYMTEPASEYYSNAEYARFTRDGENMAPQLYSGVVPAAHGPSVPAMLVDADSSMDADGHGAESECDKSDDTTTTSLKQRMASMEAELQRLRSLVPAAEKSRTSFSSKASPSSSSAAPCTTSGAPGSEHTGRKRSPPPIACESLAPPQEESHRESKKQCREGFGEASFGISLGIERELSWDLASMFSSSTPTNAQNNIFSPCKGLITPSRSSLPPSLPGCPLLPSSLRT